jgi:hypothetical protein
MLNCRHKNLKMESISDVALAGFKNYKAFFNYRQNRCTMFAKWKIAKTIPKPESGRSGIGYFR